MKISLRCEVIEVRKDNNYDYFLEKSKEEIHSTLFILKNNDLITGTVRLPNDLGFGKIYQIIVDLDNPLEVVSKAS